ncbi:hypothetical protein BSL78_12491 [Apostichopus japonicus]|uniref:Uncharacterized protein n=1 Tax=Stichopus japonicus TaxID=307972 RepID=A0A2G8KRQ7_STIJA|nr:hypothetical protein BSL78_12491 [Apostichopus japonicus]
MFTNGCSSERKISLLAVMTGAFVPLLSLDQLESQFLSIVFPEVQNLFDVQLTSILSSLEDEASTTSQVQEILKKHLQMSVDILGPLESILQCVTQKTSSAIHLNKVHSIPLPTLSIIQKSFEHCKESNTIYTVHFEALSGQLSLFFKKTFTLQKALMSLLDLAEIQPLDDNIQQVVTQVGKDFHGLCGIIGSMDASLMATTWKFLVKFVTKHKNCFDVSLQVPVIVAGLCSEIKSHFQHALKSAPLEPKENSSSPQTNDQKAFSKTVKICGLFAKMLLHLLKEFESSLDECCTVLYELVVYLNSHFPPSLLAPSITANSEEELRRSFLVCIEPLLQMLVPCRRFCANLLNPKQDLEEEFHPFGYLITLTNVLAHLPKCDEEIQDRYHGLTVVEGDPTFDSVVQCVLQTVAKCYTECSLPVMMPGVMHDGHPQTKVTLHEHTVTYLNSFLATTTPRQFSKTVQCLLKAVISDEFTKALVAMDVWCFLARYGTAEVCFNHCKFLTRLVKSLRTNQSPGCIHLCLLLQRLVPLMAESSQNEFIQCFPPADHPNLWSRLPLQTFSLDFRKEVCLLLASHYLKTMDIYSQSKNVETLVNLHGAAVDMCRVLHQHRPGPLPIQPRSELAKCTLDCLRSMPLKNKNLEPILSPLLEICSHLLLEFSLGDLETILKVTCSTSSSMALQSSSISLLHNLGQLTLPDQTQNDGLFELIPRVFSSLLCDKSPILQQLALEAFSKFAEETTHEHLVPECLHDDATKNTVVEFLNQNAVPIPDNKSDEELLKEQYKSVVNRREAWNKSKEETEVQPRPLMHDRSVSRTDQDLREPQPKKLRVDSEKSLEMELKEIEYGMQRVKQLISFSATNLLG